MKRALVVVAIGACAVIALRAAMKRAGPRMEEAWRRKLEEAPDDFPPKWMFLNVSAIREQTERIVKMLEERERASA